MKILKKILLLISSCVLLFSITAEAKDISVIVDGKNLSMDSAPVIQNDRVLIPVRALFEEIGGNVEWFPDSQRVVINYDSTKIILAIGRSSAFVSGKEVDLDVPAKIISNRTLIPVRFVAENLNMNVDWDSQNQSVIISTDNSDKPSTTPDIQTKSLTSASVTYDSSDVIITLKGIGGLKPSYMYLSSPGRMVFDFSPAKLDYFDSIEVKDANISKVRFGQFNDTTSRIVIDVGYKVYYDVETSGDDVLLKLSRDEITEVKDNYKSSFVLKDSMKDKLVVIDPGHGGVDVGTIGKFNGKDIYEKNVNIKISQYLNQYLNNNGVKTYMLRKNDESVDIYDRPKIANEMNAYMFLSIHNNASSNPETSGVQVYYSDSTPAFEKISNKTWANYYYEAIASLGAEKRGLIDNSRYIVIGKSNMPSIIVENAFMSNSDDMTKLMDDNYLKKLAMKICDSTIQTLNNSK